MCEYASAVQEARGDRYQGFRVAADVAWLARHEVAREVWPGCEWGADLLAKRLPFTALRLYDPQDWPPLDLGLLRAVHSRSIGEVAREAEPGLCVQAQRDGSI
ncbi:MEDS domain-containing protein [Actinoplanes subtropicus]|uniref:MEDS domain-containing protein n=1 Tax=Actinoplanes subtropicus TaxID=543632 RepID=UPI003CCB806A